MTTIRKIVTSKIDGNDANSTNTSEIRPFGEAAFYIDYNWPSEKPTLMIFDGVRNHRDSKVLAPGILWGSNADAGDGSGADTIKLIPDAESFGAGSDQYIVVDPTGGEPGHIHLRAGGTQDSSGADLYLGGEQNFVRISDTNDSVTIKTTFVGEGETNYFWNFNSAGILSLPGSLLFGNGTEVTGNSVTVPADSTFEFSLNHYPTESGMATANSAPNFLFVDISENDDITVVQAGWQVNGGSPQAPIWSTVIETTTIGSEYRIVVLGFDFVPGTLYTFRNPTPAESLWQFDEFGNLITPGSGSISHRVNDLKIEVVGGTDVIVLRTAGGDVVVTASGDLQLDGSITAGSIRGQGTLGSSVNIVTTTTQGDPAKDWTFIHNGQGALLVPTGSAIKSENRFHVTAHADSFVNFSNIVDFDTNSSLDFTDINIINPQTYILDSINPASPNYIGDTGAKVRIVHEDNRVYETTLTSGFASNGTDPFTGLPRYTATVASINVSASLIKDIGIGTAATWQFSQNGEIKLPGGATVRDLLGSTPDDSVLILGAGTTIGENQRAARIGINGSVEGISIGAGPHDWLFTNDGTLTFPDSTEQTTAWSGGRVVAAPTSSMGASGDLAGDLAFSASYIYYCTSNYAGTTYSAYAESDNGGSGADTTFKIRYVGAGFDFNTFLLTTTDLTGFTIAGPGVTGTVTITGAGVPTGTPDEYSFPITGTFSQQAGGSYTLSAGANIWKRVAWSADTW